LNFLQICQRVKQECGVSGTLSTVVSQSGELKRIVDWAATAYDDICASRNDWKFLRSAFTFTTTSGDDEYEITDTFDTRGRGGTNIGFQRWWEQTFRIYRQSAGVSQQTFLPYWEWVDFRDYWLLASQQNGAPQCFTIRPDDDCLLLGPKPDAAYVVTGEFQITAPILTQNTEEPLIPPQYHMAIVWRAVQSYAAYEETAAKYATAEREYKRIMDGLESIQRPTWSLAGPLA
jgi:hypothetical protein